MKNLIKRILQEEFDDLQWIHDIEPRKIEYKILEPCTFCDKKEWNMHLSDYAVELLLNHSDFYDRFSRDRNKEVVYGYMPYKQGGTKYRMTVIFKNRGDGWWNVYGRSGDYGWGSVYITKGHTYGKRVRMQIYNQLIKKLEELT